MNNKAAAGSCVSGRGPDSTALRAPRGLRSHDQEGQKRPALAAVVLPRLPAQRRAPPAVRGGLALGVWTAERFASSVRPISKRRSRSPLRSTGCSSPVNSSIRSSRRRPWRKANQIGKLCAAAILNAPCLPYDRNRVVPPPRIPARSTLAPRQLAGARLTAEALRPR